MSRIGILGASPPTSPASFHIWDGFLQGIRELGYVEGKTIIIEGRYSEGRTERLPTLAAELVRLKVDVIVAAAGTLAAHAAQRATSTIPIGAFATIRRDRIGAVTMLPSALHAQHLRRIAELALRARVPTISWQREFASVGGLMAYGANQGEMSRRAATYVDRILKGANPAEMPVEQPTQFELVLNLRTAKALRLAIPQSLRLRADEVIQ